MYLTSSCDLLIFFIFQYFFLQSQIKTRRQTTININLFKIHHHHACIQDFMRNILFHLEKIALFRITLPQISTFPNKDEPLTFSASANSHNHSTIVCSFLVIFYPPNSVHGYVRDRCVNHDNVIVWLG